MKITNQLGLSAAWVTAVSNDTYDRKGWRSATDLVKPPRVSELYRRHDDEMVEDVTDRIWLLLGEAVHYILEKGSENDENAITEERLVIEFDGVEISLKPDRVELIPESNPPQYHLKDFKITTVWSYIYPIKEDWVAQTNIYAYFLRKIGINVTRISIEAAFKDWHERDFLQKKDEYPPHDMAILPVQTWIDDDCEKYLRERIRQHQLAEVLDDNDLPKCTELERWASKDQFVVIDPHTKTNKGKGLPFCRAMNGSKCDTRAEAEAFVKSKKDKKDLKIFFRPGESKRCEKYCSANKFCNQFNTEIHPEF